VNDLRGKILINTNVDINVSTHTTRFWNNLHQVCSKSK